MYQFIRSVLRAQARPAPRPGGFGEFRPAGPDDGSSSVALSRLRAARRRIDESRLLELPGFTFAFPGLTLARAVGDVAAVARVLHPG